MYATEKTNKQKQQQKTIDFQHLVGIKNIFEYVILKILNGSYSFMDISKWTYQTGSLFV